MKSRILKSLDQSDNDTLKPHALKFIETLVLTFSHHDPPAPGDKKNKMDTFSLDRIPSGHALLAPGILEREGDSYVTLLVEQMRKPGQTYAERIVGREEDNERENGGRQRRERGTGIGVGLIHCLQSHDSQLSREHTCSHSTPPPSLHSEDLTSSHLHPATTLSLPLLLCPLPATKRQPFPPPRPPIHPPPSPRHPHSLGRCACR